METSLRPGPARTRRFPPPQPHRLAEVPQRLVVTASQGQLLRQVVVSGGRLGTDADCLAELLDGRIVIAHGREQVAVQMPGEGRVRIQLYSLKGVLDGLQR